MDFTGLKKGEIYIYNYVGNTFLIGKCAEDNSDKVSNYIYKREKEVPDDVLYGECECPGTHLITSASTEDKQWLEACIKASKFVPKEKALKSEDWCTVHVPGKPKPTQNSGYNSYFKDLRPATPDEVMAATSEDEKAPEDLGMKLLEEAKAKFPIGCVFRDAMHGRQYTCTGNFYLGIDRDVALCTTAEKGSGIGEYLFYNKKWAEKVESNNNSKKEETMPKFKIGDEVIGNSSNTYYTTKKGWIGKVIDVKSNVEENIYVSGLTKSGTPTKHWVSDKQFDLYSESSHGGAESNYPDVTKDYEGECFRVTNLNGLSGVSKGDIIQLVNVQNEFNVGYKNISKGSVLSSPSYGWTVANNSANRWLEYLPEYVPPKVKEEKPKRADLIAEAKKRFPKGTRFKDAHTKEMYTVDRFDDSEGSSGWYTESYVIIYVIEKKGSGAYLYLNGKWAEIVSESKSKETDDDAILREAKRKYKAGIRIKSASSGDEYTVQPHSSLRVEYGNVCNGLHGFLYYRGKWADIIEAKADRGPSVGDAIRRYPPGTTVRNVALTEATFTVSSSDKIEKTTYHGGYPSELSGISIPGKGWLYIETMGWAMIESSAMEEKTSRRDKKKSAFGGPTKGTQRKTSKPGRIMVLDEDPIITISTKSKEPKRRFEVL